MAGQSHVCKFTWQVATAVQQFVLHPLNSALRLNAIAVKKLFSPCVPCQDWREPRV